MSNRPYDPLPHLAALLRALEWSRPIGGVEVLPGSPHGICVQLHTGLGLTGPQTAPEYERALARQLLYELAWAPYQEFGIPDPAAETPEAPKGPVLIQATGYRDRMIIIYWSPGKLCE